MKTIVIYNSQTGFTKRYAQWIAQAAGADCFALSDAKKEICLHMKQLFMADGHAEAVFINSAGLKAIWINGPAKN